jgi:hypothetical protein
MNNKLFFQKFDGTDRISILTCETWHNAFSHANTFCYNLYLVVWNNTKVIKNGEVLCLPGCDAMSVLPNIPEQGTVFIFWASGIQDPKRWRLDTGSNIQSH